MALFTQTPTQDSQIRLRYAQEIAASCPESLFAEIALTGSSARGLANNDSDIEINFWLKDLPPIKQRAKWLIDLGVTDIVAHTQPRSDGSIWVNGIYKDIELEAGWQTFADLESSLNELIEARTTDNKKLRLAELILSAKSLRGSGTLNHWQAILQNYPEALADKLIADALSGWLNEENWLETRLANNDFESDSARIYRILFALNHRWEINWKWAHHILPNLKIAPKNIQKFVGVQHVEPENTQNVSEQSTLKSPSPLGEGDLGGEVKLGLDLIIETLALINPSFPKRNRATTMFQNIQKEYATHT